LDEIDDTPCDETTQRSYPVNGDKQQSPSPETGHLHGELGGALNGYLQKELGGEPSTLSPIPIPDPKK
jgi:hypothetical protein